MRTDYEKTSREIAAILEEPLDPPEGEKRYKSALMMIRPMKGHFDNLYDMVSKLAGETDYYLGVTKISYVEDQDPIWIGVRVEREHLDELYSLLKEELSDKCCIVAGSEGIATILYEIP